MFLIIVWTFAVTLARTIRRPNDFSEAHWLLDYRFGFIKRGLVGAISNRVTETLGIEMTPNVILALSAIFLLLLSGALLYLLHRLSIASRRYDRDGVLVGLVFASSPFIVMSAHTIGYFDSLILTLTIISIALVLHGRPYAATVPAIVAILAHENYMLVGFPLVCLASFDSCVRKKEQNRWTSHILAACISVVAFLVVSALDLIHPDRGELQAQLTAHLDSFGFVSTRSAAVAIYQTTSLIDFFRHQSEFFFARLFHPQIWGCVGATMMTLVVFMHERFRLRPYSLFSLMILGAAFAPLAMHAIAWDTARISTYPIAGILLGIWILAKNRTPDTRHSSDAVLLVATIALVMNVFITIPLMDGEVDRLTFLQRALLYAPAMILLVAVCIERQLPHWLAEFTATPPAGEKHSNMTDATRRDLQGSQ